MKPLSVAVRSVVSVLLFACVPVANAVSQNITAVFRPDPSKPNENIFTNTTPQSGYCSTHPTHCGTMFSIRLPLSFNSTSPIQPYHEEPRHGAMFKVPADWRTVWVTHASTGETESVEVRWSGIGSQYRLSDSAVNLVGGG